MMRLFIKLPTAVIVLVTLIIWVVYFMTTDIFTLPRVKMPMHGDFKLHFGGRNQSFEIVEPFCANKSDKGIVNGWPPTKSREVRHYIPENPVEEENLSHCRSFAELTNLTALVIIHSRPSNVNERNVNRKTWMSYMNMFPSNEIKVFYVVGLPHAKGEIDVEAKKILDEETRNNCDILQGNFVIHRKKLWWSRDI